MMRAVALLVVACGCRVAVSSNVDATTPSGDGLPERVVTDAALWADVRAPDGGAMPDRPPDVSGDVQPDGGDAGFGDGAPGQGCGLLVGSCPGSEGCYPFPFESPSPAMTRC